MDGVPLQAGVLDMNGLTDEPETLRRETLIHIGNGLSDYYADVLEEAIPDRVTDLLRLLVAPEEAIPRTKDLKR
jgi:hypothetical protein